MASSPYPAAASNKRGGVLYLVGTPIGNLEDVTLRALRILQEVDLIACEDTRQTQKLLTHYDIHTRTVSYHEHNEMVRASELVLELEQGMRIALVSDAGMPGISDPGQHLVALAARHGVPVVPVPGASALVAALAASGLAADNFHFVGFLPARRTQRRKALRELAAQPGTLVVYEAPRRLREALHDLLDVLGDRQVVIAREVTKIHEEFLRGRISQVLKEMKEREIKGEITLLVAPESKPPRSFEARRRASISKRVQELQRKRGLDLKAALKVVAREQGMSRDEAYRRLQEERTLRN
ncbi:MAG: 16S rRNA (cytidine(1402)-2'-O)-methyltransferase [Acidobacteria bacterium]|nr:16S rRNA (cytidine(1402)-2'-O)-methyltransferase [Acidobacteriota bacterium]